MGTQIKMRKKKMALWLPVTNFISAEIKKNDRQCQEGEKSCCIKKNKQSPTPEISVIMIMSLNL